MKRPVFCVLIPALLPMAGTLGCSGKSREPGHGQTRSSQPASSTMEGENVSTHQGKVSPTYQGKTLRDGVKLTDDEDPAVRIYAAIALGMIGPDTKAAVPDLIGPAPDEEMDLGLHAKVIEALIVRRLSTAQAPVHWEYRT